MGVRTPNHPNLFTMMFIDTHCHLYDEAFDNDRSEAVERAVANGVGTMLLPDIDIDNTDRLESLCRQYPQHFLPMAGLHPTSVNEDYASQLDHVKRLLFSPDNPMSYVAVGEIGMDLYWDRTYEDLQRLVLKTQLQWSLELGLPVALHIRKAHNEVFALLREINRPQWRGVMHCFGGSIQEARRAIEMGFHIGIGGVVTFKNATMAEVAKEIPIEKILLETDAPYLAPVPYRGKRNESSYIPVIAQCIADLRGITIDEVARQTTANAIELFNIGC